MNTRNVCAIAVLASLLGACTTTPPNQPNVLVLPGTGKNFEQFRADNDICRQYAHEQLAGAGPDAVGVDSGVRSAALGTLLGAAAGAAINGGRGAGVGAGAGLAMGGLAGSGAAETSASRQQQRYDNGFVQCMYAKGHRVPVPGGDLASDFFRGSPNGRYVAPPPPGTPAPPPPR